MIKSADHHDLKGMPFALIEYLRNSHQHLGSEGQTQRSVLKRIKDNPTLIGLEARVEMFPARSFMNTHGRTLCCPDLIAYDGNIFSVIEAGCELIYKQLDTAHQIFMNNFKIHPQLIAVRIDYRKGSFQYRRILQGGLASEYVQVEPASVQIEPDPRPWPSMEHPPRY